MPPGTPDWVSLLSRHCSLSLCPPRLGQRGIGEGEEDTFRQVNLESNLAVLRTATYGVYVLNPATGDAHPNGKTSLQHMNPIMPLYAPHHSFIHHQVHLEATAQIQFAVLIAH